MGHDSISPFPPEPVLKPLMLQNWEWLTFLHWAFEPDIIRNLLPTQIVLDTYDGKAWVALTPFLLTHLRPPALPSFPWISKFPETNVRTYVRGPDGKRGVWFFTLEADRLIAVLGARWWYHLPYRWASMSVERRGDIVEYQGKRKASFGGGHSNIIVQPGDLMQPGDFDHFLTARYTLYAVSSNCLACAHIEHAPWPLRSARLLDLDQDLFSNSGVPQPTGEPLVHFSEYLTVKIGALHWLS